VHWGLIEQAPLKYETLVTPTRIRWSGTEHRGQLTRWKWEGQTFEYRHIPAREMFGIRLARVDSETEVPMFDRERCLLEEALRAPMSAATILADHRDEIDHHRLASYARKQGEPAVALIEGLMGRLALAA
jgi:hypothetical protein